MAQRRMRLVFLGLVVATRAFHAPLALRRTPSFRDPRLRTSRRAGIVSMALGSLEGAMVVFLQELPPVRVPESDSQTVAQLIMLVY